MHVWLAVRNFFAAAKNAESGHSGRNATASMFNKIANLPSVWTLFVSS